MAVKPTNVVLSPSAPKVLASKPIQLNNLNVSLLVTSNIINERNGGYENVEEVFSIAQPTANLLSKLDSLSPSNVKGDGKSCPTLCHVSSLTLPIAMDGLIVAIQTQAEYLGKKKSWTRKIVLLTNGECPFEPEHWEAAVQKMDDFGVSLTVVSVLHLNVFNRR